MSFTSAKIRISRIIDNLSKDRERNAKIYGEETIALVNDRLESKGEDADGKKFPLYSKNNLAYKTALQTIQNSNRPSAAKELKPGQTSYEDIRKLLGLPINRRTHVFTGNMLKSINAYIVQNTEEITIVEIKSANAELQERLNKNSNRMGTNLLYLNDDEIKFLESVNRERIKNAINK